MKPVAILQVRGYFNHEKNCPESWPGACQVTAHGGVDTDKEGIFHGLKREIKEELGDIASFIINDCINNDYEIPVVYDDIRGDRRNVNHWLHLRNPLIIDAIGYGPASSRIKIINEEDLPKIKNLLKFSKDEGVPPNVIAMFPDEIRTVKEVFKRLGN